MSNDQLQSIMALVKKLAMSGGSGSSLTQRMTMVDEIESAIREAIAAPGVAQGWQPSMPETWSVEVVANGVSLVSIGQNWLSGATDPDEQTILGAAQHLLSFIGYGLPPSSFDPEDPAAPSPTAEQPVSIKGGNE